MNASFWKNDISRDGRWVLPAALILAFLLSALQAGGFWGFFLAASLGFFALGAARRWAAEDSPRAGRALMWILASAFLVRILAAAALTVFLPLYGHGNEEERAGYVFTDSYRRDAQAWALARSDDPILGAFGNAYYTDQYGGLLAVSAWSYRYLSPDAHRPLLISLLASLVAALGIPFLWRALRRIEGESLAKASSWILALYPEAVLAGGAQMREPFLITFTAMMLWGFFDWREHRRAWGWLAAGAAGLLLFSPAVFLVMFLALSALFWLERRARPLSWKLLLGGAGIFILGVAVFAFGVNRAGALGAHSPFGVIQKWFHEAVKWDIYQLERGSGWMQKLFGEMGETARLFFVAIYGMLRPLLPAILVVPTNPVWRVIGFLRSAGWYAMLPLLLYGIFPAWKTEDDARRRVILWAGAVAWIWIFVASLRAGGDQWDNPRYRSILLIFQAIFAAYAWLSYRRRKDILFSGILLSEIAAMGVFFRWYLGRYNAEWSVFPFWSAALWSLSLILLIFFGAVLFAHRRRKKR